MVMAVSLNLIPHNNTVLHNMDQVQVLAVILAAAGVVVEVVATAAITMAPPTQQHIRLEDTEAAAEVVAAIPMDLVVMEVPLEVAEVVTIPAAMAAAVVPTIRNLVADLKIGAILLEAAVTVSSV